MSLVGSQYGSDNLRVRYHRNTRPFRVHAFKGLHDSMSVIKRNVPYVIPSGRFKALTSSSIVRVKGGRRSNFRPFASDLFRPIGGRRRANH